MKSGTLYGIHAEASSQAVPLMRKYQAAGVQVSCILAHENPGLCVDAKAINPAIVTLARWANPNTRWEGMQDVATWGLEERRDYAAHCIDLIFTRTNETEYQASDYFVAGWNEADPPEPFGLGYKAMAETFIMVCQEATRRSPEMVARGLHPIKLALPGFNNGTPEWWEMQAMKDTGLFGLMKSRGDIFLVHEGLWWDEPPNSGLGDLIPGAPRVPAFGGSKIGRVNYWYGLLGLDIPFVVSEFYDGRTRATAPAVRMTYLKAYDRLIRHNPYCLGFCPFEITDAVGGSWWQVDFTPLFESAEMLADMVAERDKPNPTPQGGPIPPEDDMDDAQRAKNAKIREHANAILVLAADEPTPAPTEHTMRDKTNQQVINLFNTLFGSTGRLESVLSVAQRSVMYNGRQALYTGPSVEVMNLTQDDRARVLAALVSQG